MTTTERKLSLLSTIADGLRERGFDTSFDNDQDSGELIVEFEGETFIIGMEDIGVDSEDEDYEDSFEVYDSEDYEDYEDYEG